MIFDDNLMLLYLFNYLYGSKRKSFFTPISSRKHTVEEFFLILDYGGVLKLF